jgi:hypothetical protein
VNTPPQAAQLADVFQHSNANVEWRNGDLRFFGRKACSMFATVLTSVEISPAPLSPPRQAVG